MYVYISGIVKKTYDNNNILYSVVSARLWIITYAAGS